MDFALAKELEAAGFPQGGAGRFLSPPDKIVVRMEDRVYSPTLSELIAACEAFSLLAKRAPSEWHATSAANEGIAFEGTGTTPQEAVARLWLALNRPFRSS